MWKCRHDSCESSSVPSRLNVKFDTSVIRSDSTQSSANVFGKTRQRPKIGGEITEHTETNPGLFHTWFGQGRCFFFFCAWISLISLSWDIILPKNMYLAVYGINIFTEATYLLYCLGRFIDTRYRLMKMRKFLMSSCTDVRTSSFEWNGDVSLLSEMNLWPLKVERIEEVLYYL